MGRLRGRLVLVTVLLWGRVFVSAASTASSAPAEGAQKPVRDAGTGSSDPILPTKNITLPVCLKNVAPVYPRKARKAGLEGKVIVQAVIGADGKVGEVLVLTSSNEAFNKSAVDAVRRRIYRPARKDGRPVPIYYTIRVDFHLR